MPRRPARPPRVVLVTPATRFGSWAILEKVIRASSDRVNWSVVSYGHPAADLDGVQVVALPELGDYPRLARLLSHPRMLWLNAIYVLPLAILSWGVVARRRADAVLANGAAVAIAASPLRLRGTRLLLSWNGYIGHATPLVRSAARLALRAVDLAVVNSSGSADDLATILDRSRIRVVPHWADQRFFDVPLRRPPRLRLEVLFVGRLDTEKFAQCLRVCRDLAATNGVRLTAVGGGPLEAELRGPGLRHLGYIADLDRLARVYADADVVWAPGDVTYLSVPGVEALAAGCPVIVSDVPAVDAHAAKGARIPRTLIPPTVGRVVDGVRDDEAKAILESWRTRGITDDEREQCRAYALERHSPRNVELIVTALRR
jgi:glycosyltransferase involved in cell wall biosynthesis